MTIKNEALKLEVARELGLFDKVMNDGWKSLTAKETGRIGGLVSRKVKTIRPNLLSDEIKH